jgi:Type II CAAX prenyl endopeptidase Rce1-like
LCSYVIDVYTQQKSFVDHLPVKNPKRESLYFLLCIFLGLILVYFRFLGAVKWEDLHKGIRIALLPLMLFVYPIGLAIILFLLKYKLKDLGLRLQGLTIALPIILILVITNRIVSPQSLTWDVLMREGGGLFGVFVIGFVVAGLSEEFFRVIGQTRIGCFLNNKALGWFIASLLWALLHCPKWYSEKHDVFGALMSAIKILPIGLMWGYMTHRIKNFLPALVVHGSNYWGLQNF